MSLSRSSRERAFRRLEVIQPKFEFGLPDGAYVNASIPQGYKRVSIDANNDLEFIEQRFYSQVLLYEPFADPDFEGRKRYEYKHKVLKDEIHLLNFDYYSMKKLSYL